MAKPTPAVPASAPPTTPPPSSAECAAVIGRLREDLQKLESRRDGIQGERERLAAAALLDNQPGAAAALSELNSASLAAGVEIENVSAAITAAQSRLKAAEAREAAAAEVQKAHEARALLTARQELSEQAQLALREFAEKMERLIMAGRQLRSLTDRASSDAHDGLCLRVAMQLSRCDLHRRGLLSSEPLPDERMRHPLSELIAHIDLGARQWADGLIDGEQQQTRSAA